MMCLSQPLQPGCDPNSEENLSQFGSSLSGPGLILWLVIAIKQEVQDTRDKARPKGFTAPSFLLETNKFCFPPKLQFLSMSKQCGDQSSCGLAGLRADKRCLVAVPSSGLWVCLSKYFKGWQWSAHFYYIRGAELLALGDTDYNAVTSFSHQRANFSLFSNRNTTWQVNMISKEKLSTRVFTSLSCPCYCTEWLTFGERESHICPHVT